MARRIGRLWQEYQNRIVPRTAPPVQITQSRRAFYAGVQACFAACVAATEEAHDDEAASAALIEEIAQELRDFTAQVAAGRA